MDKLRALEYFVAAAEAGSLAGAARQLEVSVPSVHKLISALERRLAVRLFDRTVRGLTLTASGEVYLESSRPLLAELEAIDRAITRSAVQPSGTLVVGAHSQLAQHLLLPSLPRFHARYPDIQIDLRVIHRLSDDDAAPVDVFLVHGWPEAGQLVQRRLGQTQTFIVASPAYWAARGLPRHPEELAGHSCLLMRNPAGILLDLWEFERPGEEKVSVKVGGWLSSNDREVVLDAVLAGEGVGRFTRLTTSVHLASGRLVPGLVDWTVLGGPPVNLLYRANHRRTPRVRLFIDHVSALLGQSDGEEARGLSQLPVERPHWHRLGYGRASSVLRTRR